MTLIEMLIALTVFSIVMAGTLSALRRQSSAFAQGSEHMAVLQNARFSVSMLEQDLRTAGSGVPDLQPFIVYADDDVIAFNANYVTNVSSDISAVYFEPNAPNGSVSAMTKAMRTAVPNSAFMYPDTNYMVGAVNSFAETIVFYFSLDSSTARTDDYILWRKVNADAAELVARNLLKTEGGPFFSYTREQMLAGAKRVLRPVNPSVLPLRHAIALHGAPADTGTISVVDSLRGVHVNLTATNGMSGDRERTQSLTRTFRLPNAGLANRRTCGDEPLALGAFGAVASLDVNGLPIVTLAWGQSIDENAGERDVFRYVIWRRVFGTTDWGDPYLSIPSGNPNYVYVDADVVSGDVLQYAVAAQDCTPSLSTLASSAAVVIP
jgi:prepilin-type N-terminal cleavage/methylation domain-containing protein